MDEVLLNRVCSYDCRAFSLTSKLMVKVIKSEMIAEVARVFQVIEESQADLLVNFVFFQIHTLLPDLANVLKGLKIAGYKMAHKKSPSFVLKHLLI
jgi:hypothetical protein